MGDAQSGRPQQDDVDEDSPHQGRSEERLPLGMDKDVELGQEAGPEANLVVGIRRQGPGVRVIDVGLRRVR